MILECPNCGTYYDTPAIIPPEGRKVRCAKCANTWLAMPPPSEASESPAEPELSAPERDAAEPGAPATSEPEVAGEAVASDDSAGDQGSEQVAAQQETEARLSVEEEEPEPQLTDEPDTAPDEAAPEEAAADATAAAAADADMAESDEAPEPSPTTADDDSAVGEDGAEPAAEEEAPPAEEEVRVGDFSHQGTGPARSPMQEILATVADTQTVDQGPDEGLIEPDAAGDQRRSSEPVGGEEAEIMASATERETADISSPEAASLEHDAGMADGEVARDQPAAVAPATAAAKDFQPSTGQLVSWAMLALLVVIGFTLAVVNREAVVRNLPGSASFYGGLGLTVNLRGLDFENVKSTWTMEADQPVLEVSGEIVNITDGQMAVPVVVFALHDEDGVEVHRWQAEVTDKPLEAGGRTQFSARIPSPPRSSKSVQVKFAEAQ